VRIKLLNASSWLLSWFFSWLSSRPQQGSQLLFDSNPLFWRGIGYDNQIVALTPATEKGNCLFPAYHVLIVVNSLWLGRVFSKPQDPPPDQLQCQQIPKWPRVRLVLKCLKRVE
jgi:hypothetical protein